MRTRTIAGTRVTALGAGDVDLGTSASRGVDARDVRAALDTALELGITLVDVRADADSQRFVGDAVRARRLRDTVVVATRVPTLAERPGMPRRDTLPERLPAAYVQERVEAALRATRLDVLPLVHLALRPAWRTSTAWAELVGTCARLVREGKVLAWGADLDPADVTSVTKTDAPAPTAIIDIAAATAVPTTVVTVDDATAALIAEPWLAAVAVAYNPCERAAEPLLAACAARDLPVLARRPLAGGAFGGELGPGVRLVPRDDRALDDATLTRIAVEVARLAPLVRDTPPAARASDAARAVLERGRRPDHLEATTVGELVLRFVLDRGAIPLPRLHRPAHVVTALACLVAPPLSPDVVSRILDN